MYIHPLDLEVTDEGGGATVRHDLYTHTRHAHRPLYVTLEFLWQQNQQKITLRENKSFLICIFN